MQIKKKKKKFHSIHIYLQKNRTILSSHVTLMTGQGHQSQCKCVKLKKGQHLTQYQKSRLNSSQAKIINQSFGGGKTVPFLPPV